MWEYTKTINGSRVQATLKANEFELKFILAYWGLIGFDFRFIDLSNVFIDRSRVPKYNFKAPNKRTNFIHKFFYRTLMKEISTRWRKNCFLFPLYGKMLFEKGET
jgi:hypothetical protein